jgi:hypothetical protein
MDITAETRLLELVNGCWTTQAVYAATELGIADALAGGPMTAGDLAARLALDAPAAERLLRALVSLGVCSHGADGVYTLTDTGALLRDDHPRSLRAWCLMTGRHLWNFWAALPDVVRTGIHVHGRAGAPNRFRMLDDRPAEAADFHRAMTELSRMVGAAVAQAVAKLASPGATVVDVGGGHGELLCAVLRHSPGLRGVVLDLPSAAAGAGELLHAYGLEERAQVATGDFFATVPAGDLLLLKTVLHDWDDAAACTILRVCSQALRPGGVVLVIERVLPETVGNEARDRAACRADLNMLVATGGRERSANDFARLAGDAGLAIIERTPAPAGFTMMVCARPSQQANG